MGNNLKACCTEGGNDLLHHINYGDDTQKSITKKTVVDRKQELINQALLS